MMRRIPVVLGLSLLATLPIRAQDKKPAAKPQPKTISLSGCVVANEKTPDQFTLDDATEGKYRLSGIKLGDYVGQRVQLAGAVVESKRLVIKGGLLPNANVAAQAGGWTRRAPQSPHPEEQRDRERSTCRNSK